MGPNGSGKSTLSATLAGREDYQVDSGEVTFNSKDLLALDPEERAGEGIFLHSNTQLKFQASVTSFSANFSECSS